MYRLVVAWRYLWSRLVSYIGAALLALAVMLFILVMAVMEGMGEVLRENIRKSNAHVELLAPAGPGIDRWREVSASVAKLEHVIGVTPFIVGGGQVQSQRYRFQALIRGVDLDREREVSGTGRYLGPDLSWDTHDESGLPGAIVGFRVAEQMEIEKGEPIRLSVQQAGQSDATGRAAFEVTGEFKTESLWFDRNILIPLDQAQKLFGTGDRVTGLGVWLDDYRNAHAVKRAIQYSMLDLDQDERAFFNTLSSEPQPVETLAARARVGVPKAREMLSRLEIKGASREVGRRRGYWVEAVEPQVKTWAEQQPDLFRAMAQEAWIMRIILCIVILFVAVLIFCLLWVMVDVKIPDIGILVALGARTSGIVSIFVFDGLIIGVVGAAAGVAIGSVLAMNLDSIAAVLAFFNLNVFPEEMFYGSGDGLPSVLSVADVVLVSVVAVLCSLVASIAPAVKAAWQEPIESLRHE
jgi:lipoprotein-releasing system permease protein